MSATTQGKGKMTKEAAGALLRKFMSTETAQEERDVIAEIFEALTDGVKPTLEEINDIRYADL
jgi:hypothetical protein